MINSQDFNNPQEEIHKLPSSIKSYNPNPYLYHLLQ